MRPSGLLPLIFLLSASTAVAPARADSTSATCLFSCHDHTVPVEKGPCTFSQRQGNVTVRFGERDFNFPSAEQDRTYQRSASREGIRFNREGMCTLRVFWQTAQAAIAKPPGWEHDNFFWAAGRGRALLGGR